MMTKIKWLLIGVASLFFLSSCNDEKVISNNQLVRTISVTGQDFVDGDGIVGTRASYSVDGTGFHFTWTQGDTVGIYPVGGDQVAFPISSGEGSQTAQFDGGAWALRSSYSYAAYYPFSSRNYHIDETSLPVNYVGQSQNGNGTLDGMDRFDYQASVATNPDADGNVNISLKHLGCFVRIQLTMPMADTYKSVTLQSNNTPFVTSGTYDLTQETVAITPITTSSSITIKLNNTSTTADNKVLTIYAMMAPADLSSSEITITVTGTTYQSYSATVNGKNMQASKAYSYAATVKSGTNINGSDVEWDDNGEEIIHVEYEYVDLGLSVKWATFNVGATAPEESGNYFAWGELEAKSEYYWANYRFYTSGSENSNVNDVKFLKYNTVSDRGTVDNKIALDADDDVVHVNLGGNWRMPTEAEFNELIDECTWTRILQNGVKVTKVTSKKTGYTNRFIILPAVGYMSGTSLIDIGKYAYGRYWTSSLETSADRVYQAKVLWFDFFESGETGSRGVSSNDRNKGVPVRPVCPSDTWINNVSVTLNNSELSLSIYDSETLAATIKEGSNTINYFSVTWSSSDPSVATVDEKGVVTAVSDGNATITATFKGKSSSCNVTVNKYVDLGLSVKWAMFNVGANAPEEYGDYFAWGETEPYYESGYAKENPQAHWKQGYSTGYNISNYKYCNGSYSTMTKYCSNGYYGNNGFTDNLTTLLPEDDVAYVKWGGNWRMPTEEEFWELNNNCTWQFITQNGVNGYKVSSLVDPGRSIFLPAAGYRSNTGLHYDSTQGSYDPEGRYWTKSLYTYSQNSSYSFRFFDDVADEWGVGYEDRSYGLSVRPVCP